MEKAIHIQPYTRIPLSSCHRCRPEKWEVQGRAKYLYRCGRCNRLVEVLLRMKDHKPKEEDDDKH